MSNTKLQTYFLAVILLGALTLTFFIFKPFISALVLAVVFVVVFKPVHKKILDYFNKQAGLASLLTILIILTFVIAPLTFLSMQIFQEAGQIYSYLSQGAGRGTFTNLLNTAIRDIQVYFPVAQGITVDLDQYLKQGLAWFISNIINIFSNFAKILMSLFVFLIALYYLFKDGHKIKKFVIELSPLSDVDDSVILKKLEGAVNSIVRGSLLVGLIQGTLTMIGFTLFGVPNPVLWGSITMIAALVPGVGTTLVIAPAVLYLFITGSTVPAFGLMAWGIVAVGLVDNLLGPKLMGRGMQLHPLLILLAVLGGLAFFGPIGIFLGPLTASFLIALLELHFLIARQKNIQK